jgi:hypothetical protein
MKSYSTSWNLSDIDAAEAGQFTPLLGRPWRKYRFASLDHKRFLKCATELWRQQEVSTAVDWLLKVPAKWNA